jgi:UDP-N-acetylglucosamine diphosphorylase/glucosamine-1-phosphate N-acetyltransferase
MNLVLFDREDTWTDLLPVTFTRPISEIRVGILTIREKWEKISCLPTSVSSQAYLMQKFHLHHGSDEIWADSAIIPQPILMEAIVALLPGQALLKDDLLIAFRPESEIDHWREFEMPAKPLFWNEDLIRINYPWDIFSLNDHCIREDYRMLTMGRTSSMSGSGNRFLGEENVFVEEGAKLNFATINALSGPVYIGRDAELMEGSFIRGPFALGDHSTLKIGARIYPATSIGPHCKVGGEVSNTVFQGYSNKAHEGYLGDAVIGEWCNLGADTNNSNLKNTYEEVRVWNYRKAGFIRTGLQFCGLIMGDHSKTGINTMLNTGTVIGVSANVFGAGFPRNFIPSFSWGGAHGLTEYQFNKAMQVAKAVMHRRGLALDNSDQAILEHVYNATREHRLP